MTVLFYVWLAEGTFGPAQDAGVTCRNCKGGPVIVEHWSSNCGGYEDDKYTCQAVGCGFVWWVEGIDS